uniref:hypothetical protein n=1 Tax=Kitasatospora sp. MBT63 TaxID=1444768 RepID=UPI0005399D94
PQRPGTVASPPAEQPAPLSIDGAGASAPLATAARSGGEAGIAPASGQVPSADWPNRLYADPGGGPAVRLRDGHSTEGPQTALTTALPVRYREAPGTVVVLRRTEGSVPVDLVQLFGFAGDQPVLVASRASAADPQAAAAWRIDNGALLREERVSQTGAVSTTRYTVRADGSLEESWPGAGISGGGTGRTAG